MSDVVSATATDDGIALQRLGQELLELGTTEATAHAHSALGLASRLRGDNTEALAQFG